MPRTQGIGLEMAARDLRWDWLRQEAGQCGAGAVATGHTLDDHSETVFLRLARGGGLGCLHPLAPRQELRWSPLAELRRADLRDYLGSKKIPWREDASNAEPFTARNRWRPILAEMRKEAPELDRHLFETHLQAEEAEGLAQSLIAGWEGTRWHVEDGAIALAREPWSRAGTALDTGNRPSGAWACPGNRPCCGGLHHGSPNASPTPGNPRLGGIST